MTSDDLGFTRFPRETWTDAEVRRAKERQFVLHEEMSALHRKAERFDRDLTAEEADRFAELRSEFDVLGA